MPENNLSTKAVRKPPTVSQVVDSAVLRSEILVTPTLVLRVVRSLEAGYSERNIATAEAIPEPLVRRIRQAELDRRDRHSRLIESAFPRFIETVRGLRKELDREIIDELREAS